MKASMASLVCHLIQDLFINVRIPTVERLYQVQHHQFVAQLQEVDDIEEDAAGFWISKQWLRGWIFALFHCFLPDFFFRLETNQTKNAHTGTERSSARRW